MAFDSAASSSAAAKARQAEMRTCGAARDKGALRRGVRVHGGDCWQGARMAMAAWRCALLQFWRDFGLPSEAPPSS